MKPYTIKLDDRIMLDAQRPVDRTAQADCEAHASRRSLEEPGNHFGVYYKNFSEGALGIVTSWYCRNVNYAPRGATRLSKYINGEVCHEVAPPPPLVADMLTCCINCSRSGSFVQMNRGLSGNWHCPSCGKVVP